MPKPLLLALIAFVILTSGCKKKKEDPLAVISGTWHCTVENKINRHIGYTRYIDTVIRETIDIEVTAGENGVSLPYMGYDDVLEYTDLGGSFGKSDAISEGSTSFESGHLNSMLGCGIKKYFNYDPRTDRISYDYVNNMCSFDHHELSIRGTRK